MDPVILVLAVLAVLVLSGWGFGYYARPALAEGGGPGRARWVQPLGAVGLFLAAVIVLLLVTGWRPAW